jgi:hypothetical protein
LPACRAFLVQDRRCPLRAPFLARNIFFRRSRIEAPIVDGGTLKMSNCMGTYFPHTVLYAGVVLVAIALQLALHFDVSSLEE